MLLCHDVSFSYGRDAENIPTDWRDYPCSSKMGFVCEIKNNIRLELRGLCKDSLIDKEYTGIGFINERRTFRGKYDFRLEWDKETEMWIFKSPSAESTLAFYNKSSDYPLGREPAMPRNECQCGQFRRN